MLASFSATNSASLGCREDISPSDGATVTLLGWLKSEWLARATRPRQTLPHRAALVVNLSVYRL